MIIFKKDALAADFKFSWKQSVTRSSIVSGAAMLMIWKRKIGNDIMNNDDDDGDDDDDDVDDLKEENRKWHSERSNPIDLEQKILLYA